MEVRAATYLERFRSELNHCDGLLRAGRARSKIRWAVAGAYRQRQLARSRDSGSRFNHIGKHKTYALALLFITILSLEFCLGLFVMERYLLTVSRRLRDVFRHGVPQIRVLSTSLPTRRSGPPSIKLLAGNIADDLVSLNGPSVTSEISLRSHVKIMYQH